MNLYIGRFIEGKNLPKKRKNRGNILAGRGVIRGMWGNFEKKSKPHKCYYKINLCRKFYPNWTMEKFSKLGKNFRG